MNIENSLESYNNEMIHCIIIERTNTRFNYNPNTIIGNIYVLFEMVFVDKYPFIFESGPWRCDLLAAAICLSYGHNEDHLPTT